MCLFNFIFKQGAYLVKVIKSTDNIYVEKLDGDLCVFGNEVNYLLEFPSKFIAKDFDLFFTICYYAKKAKNAKKSVYIDFDDMAKFLDYKSSLKYKDRFYNEIFEWCNRCSDIKCISKNDKKDKIRHFFKCITSDKDNKQVFFELNEVAFDYLYFFENYFKLNLREFCSLKSKGAKILLRLLVQFANLPKKNGYKELQFNVDEFCKIIKSNAIESNEVKYITNRVLNPAIKELTQKGCFNEIYYEKLKDEINKRNIKSFRICFNDDNRGDCIDIL